MIEGLCMAITLDFFEEKLGKYKKFALSAKDIYTIFATSEGWEMQKELNELFKFLKKREVKK
jgi:hypothetical protein